MDFLKNVIGSIIFVAAVLIFINVAGNVLVGQPSVEKTSVEEPSPPSNDKAETVQPEEKVEIDVAAPESTPAQPEMPAPAEEAVAQTAPAEEKTIVASSSGNIEMGAKIFRRKCMGCHLISEDGQNRTGPNLFGVVGRTKASIDGYRYSSALEKLGGTWTENELNTFIAGPRAMVPETKMTFSGIKKESQRDDIVAYLKTLSK